MVRFVSVNSECENSDAKTGDEVATDVMTDAIDELLNGASEMIPVTPSHNVAGS